MPTFTRNNAWNNGGTFNNPDLLWYAKGVGEMMSRPLNDQNSWWFFAAIHGEYVTASNAPAFPNWGAIPAPPQVPTAPLPSQNLQDLYWDQCQHQSWYFAPWHRGYLLALEAQIRAAVISLGGPSTWALPYWDYFGPGDQYEIPPAFTEPNLPDGSANPLYVSARYGPNNDGNIFIPIPPVSEACENNTVYTGSNPATRPPGFGGPRTGFSHSGRVSGNLESNPHNQVHVDVGGSAPDSPTWGLMSDPGIAALDPIFYLHHSNVDRMWAVWNEKGNSNPTDPNWLKGPAAVGEREFAMPMPDGSSWIYTPADMDSLSLLDYTYDDLAATVAAAVPSVVKPLDKLNQRLMKLGAARAEAAKATAAAAGENMDAEDNAELVGANEKPLQIKSSGARAAVKLDSGVQRKVSASLAAASNEAKAQLPDQVYLQLENVRGNIDAFKLNVSVNQQNAGTVALFGLRRASLKDGEHGGEGLTFILDITNIIDNLFLNEALDTDSLDVKIVPNQAVPDAADITVGRVSVYRQGQK
jgi:tyrosinase